MDIASGLYGFFGTSDPTTLVMDLLVAVVLAVSIAYLALELYRIYREYTRKEAPAITKTEPARPEPVKPEPVKAPEPGKQAVKPITGPGPMEAIKPTLPARTEIPAIDVVKGTLSESMMSLTQKYRLGSLTLASQDGLVIASTSKTPDQDAAVFSGLFQELYKVKQEPYYHVESKGVGLYSVESGAQKVIGVANRKDGLAPEEVKAIREDTKKVLDRFAAGK